MSPKIFRGEIYNLAQIWDHVKIKTRGKGMSILRESRPMDYNVLKGRPYGQTTRSSIIFFVCPRVLIKIIRHRVRYRHCFDKNVGMKKIRRMLFALSIVTSSKNHKIRSCIGTYSKCLPESDMVLAGRPITATSHI